MYSLLLAVIYISFISLGLPDSLLGSGWPVMQADLGVSMSFAGIITMIIAFNTIISSLLSDRLNRKFGTSWLVAVSVFLTALALLGFSLTSKFYVLCLLAIPYGLGAGAVDAAINNYVALRYNASHMSWLHCFWGLGALISPYIMGYTLTSGLGWQSAYRIVFYIQIAITILLFISLPLWKKQNRKFTEASEIENSDDLEPQTQERKHIGILGAMKIKGVLPLVIGFLVYCALEQTSMIWASSYLAGSRAFTVEKAASLGSLTYIGITAGRAVGGFIANKVKDIVQIRIGICIAIVGIVFIAIPVKNQILPIVGLVLTGVGCAPIYPSIIHSTPYNFGKENSQAIIGIQMAFAYAGTTFLPPLFGLIAERVSIALYPVFLIILALVLILMIETTNRMVSKTSPTQTD